MSAEKEILAVVEIEHPRYGKQYLVRYNGREFGLASHPQVTWDGEWHRVRDLRYNFSFDAYELPPEPKKPKRKVSTHLGLRRPK